MKKDSNYILNYLEEAYPNRLPLGKVSEYELGRLVGMQELIDNLKVKLKVIQQQEEEIK